MFQRIIYFLLILSVFSVAFADDDYDDSPEAIHAGLDAAAMKKQVEYDRCPACWFFGLGGGAAWVKPTNTTQRILADQYVTNSPQSSPMIMVHGGYRWGSHRHWLPDFYLGGRYRYFMTNYIRGNVLINANPQQSNYTFSVPSTMHVFTLYGKLDLCRFDDFAPFVLMGAGFALNIFNPYSELPNAGVAARTSPVFGEKKTVNVAYEAGIGLDYYINTQLFLSAEYDYLNMGVLSSSVGAGAWSANSMSFGDMTSHSVLFSATYLFHEE